MREHAPNLSRRSSSACCHAGLIETPREAPGVEGNRRLTAATGAILLVLLAAEGVTILAIRPLVSVHVFLGMLLVPPVVFKVGTTGYRFARYSSGGLPDRAAGPPSALLRLIGPIVVLSTAVLFATGVALLALRPHRGAVLGLHKGALSSGSARHVLAHVLRVPRLAAADWRNTDPVPGSSLRRWLLAATLVAGLVLAVATVHLAGPWHQIGGG